MQGGSLVPLLKGRDARRLAHLPLLPLLRVSRPSTACAGTTAWPRDRYKLIRFYGQDVPDGEEWELYDLEKDPHEMTTVYGDRAQADRVEDLKRELQRLRDVYRVPADETP